MKIEQYWGILYAIMKSLGVKELEIDKKYFEIDINKFVNMYYHDTLNGNIKVELREKNNEVEEEKKIPVKLETYKENDDEDYYANILKVSKNGEYEIDEATSVIVDKINEVIDYLNSKGE